MAISGVSLPVHRCLYGFQNVFSKHVETLCVLLTLFHTMAPFLCLTPWSFQGMCPSSSAQTRQKNSYSQIFINIPWPQISNPSSIPLKHTADHNYLWLLWCLTTVQNIWVLSNHRTQWWSFLHAFLAAALLSSGNYYCIHRVYEIPALDSTWLISCSLFSEWLAFSCKWSLALFLLK